MCIIFKYHQTNCHCDLIEVEQVPTSSAFGTQLSLLCYSSYQHMNNKAKNGFGFQNFSSYIWVNIFCFPTGQLDSAEI